MDITRNQIRKAKKSLGLPLSKKALFYTNKSSFPDGIIIQAVEDHDGFIKNHWWIGSRFFDRKEYTIQSIRVVYYNSGYFIQIVANDSKGSSTVRWWENVNNKEKFIVDSIECFPIY